MIDLIINLIIYGSWAFLISVMLLALYCVYIVIKVVFGGIISGVWSMCRTSAYWIIELINKDDND